MSKLTFLIFDTNEQVTEKGEAVAREAERQLYRVAAESIASSDVGATSRELDRLAADAVAGNAILLIDESDILFGPRTRGTTTGDELMMDGISVIRRLRKTGVDLIVAVRQIAGIPLRTTFTDADVIDARR